MQNRFLTAFKPEPIQKPTVDTHLNNLSPLSRSTECIRYSLLSIEFWISPDGHLREWLRRNLMLYAWLIVPAIFVMPAIGFILWQLTGWLSMLTGIVGKLIFLPILILLAFVVVKIVVTILKR